MELPRIRTIRECLEEINAMDEKSAINENVIRTMCKKGIVKSFKTGNKYMINFDDLLVKLNEFSFEI